jgi:hypothetical protein
MCESCRRDLYFDWWYVRLGDAARVHCLRGADSRARAALEYLGEPLPALTFDIRGERGDELVHAGIELREAAWLALRATILYQDASDPGVRYRVSRAT